MTIGRVVPGLSAAAERGGRDLRQPLLAAKPKWQDEREEGCAETGGGGVEAEG